RLREIDPIRAQVEQETGARWEDLSDSAKSYWRMKKGHPQWEVRPNLFTDMTGSIVEQSQSQDVQIFFDLVYGYIAHTVTAPSVTAPPGGLGPGAASVVSDANGAFSTFKEAFEAASVRRAAGNDPHILEVIVYDKHGGPALANWWEVSGKGGLLGHT